MAFEVFNKSKTCENEKWEKEICSSQNLKIMKWKYQDVHIWTDVQLMSITSCTDVQLIWFKWPRKEDMKIYNFVVWHKFRTNNFWGQKWARSWKGIKFRKSANSHHIFERFSWKIVLLMKNKKESKKFWTRKYFFFKGLRSFLPSKGWCGLQNLTCQHLI